MASAWLPQWSAAEVVGLVGEALVPSLAAAGHAPIAMALLLLSFFGSKFVMELVLQR